jgi:uncharacterized coiled-coil DUF342 family protein
MTLIDQEKIANAILDIKYNVPKTPMLTAEVQPFVALSEKLADSIVEVYQQQLTEIQNKLEKAKIVANDIRNLAKDRAADIQDFRNRVAAFSNSLIEAHDEFNKGDEK